MSFLERTVDEYKKEDYLLFCRSVLQEESHFSHEDEEMIAFIDFHRYIDSIRLLALKYRILHSNSNWIKCFIETRGAIDAFIMAMHFRFRQ